MKKMIAKTKNFVNVNKDKIEEGIMIGAPMAISALLVVAAYKAIGSSKDFNDELLNDAQEFIESKGLEEEFVEFIIEK